MNQAKHTKPVKSHKAFSLAARVKSIRYAMEGVKSFLLTEHNALIHLFLTYMVFIISLVLPVSLSELIAIVLATGFVWSAEIFNTAIEKMADFVSPEKNSSIKYIKDLAAAAVLIAAVSALIAGGIIFIPKIIRLW